MSRRNSPPAGHVISENKRSSGSPSVSPTEVRAELQKILASGIFATAERMKRFLGFIVEETLRGRGDELNEYLLGIEVYDRDEQFDPRVDSIVRVDAARLRSKIREYYASELKCGPIRIEIPKGTYKPRFEKPDRTDSEASAERHSKKQPAVRTIAVLPFADLSP